MTLTLTESQEARLSEMARHSGKPVGELLVDAATSLLSNDEQRWADVDHALGQAERGEMLDEAEMDIRVARMLSR